MRKNIVDQPDLSLSNIYCPILQTQLKFKGKVAYALRCIHDSVSSNNPNYRYNLNFLHSKTQLLLNSCRQHPDTIISELVVSIFNAIRELGPFKSTQTLMRLMMNNDYSSDLSDGLVKQACMLIDRCRMDSQESINLAYDFLKKYGNKMGRREAQYLTEFIQKYSGEFRDKKKIDLFQFESLEPSKALQMAAQQYIEKSIDQDQLVRLISKYLQQNPYNVQIIYKCAYLSALITATQNKKCIIEYLEQFSDSYGPKPILYEGKIVRNQNYLFLLQDAKQMQIKIRYVVNENVGGLQISGNVSKTQKEHLLLLQQISNKQQLTSSSQKKYKTILPAQLLTDQDTILQNLDKNKNIRDAFIFYSNFLKKKIFSDNSTTSSSKLAFLTQIHRLYLSNKSHQELFLASTLKQSKIQIQQILKSKLSDYILLPSILSSIQQKDKNYAVIMHKIQQFFREESFSAAEKTYLGYWGISLNNETIVENYIRYFFKKIKENHNIIDQILYYMQKNQLKESDLQWLYEKFTDDLERILEVILTLMESPHTDSAVQIIFELNKIENFKIFREWSSMYRWALNPLQNPNFQQPEKVLDYLQGFETLIENSSIIPIRIIERYCQIIIEHWQKFRHIHIFSIERTLGVLCSQILTDNNKLQELIGCITKLQNKRQSYNLFELSGLALQTLLSYVLDYNHEKDEADLDKQIFSYLKKKDIQQFYAKTLSQSQKRQYLQVLELYMWRFQYAETIVDGEILKKIFGVLVTRDKLRSNWGLKYSELIENCMEIVATMSHEGNLLTIPIKEILIEFSNNKKILKFCLDILQNVTQANPKALIKYNLQTYIEGALIQLLNIQEDEQLQLLLVDLVERIVLTQNSPYSLQNSSYLLKEILMSETRLEKCRYRSKMIDFILCVIEEQKIKVDCHKLRREINFIYRKYRFDTDIKERMQKSKIYSQEIEEICSQKIENKIEDEKKRKKQEEVREEKREEIQEVKNEQVNSKYQDKEAVLANEDQIPQKQSVKQEKLQTFEANAQKQENINLKILKSETPSYKETGKKSILERRQQRRRERDSPVRNNINRELETSHHIHTIKEYNVFYDGLIKKIEEKTGFNNFEQKSFEQSLVVLAETATIHSYYCQKINNYNLPTKALQIYLQNQSKNTDKLLDFYMYLARRRDRNNPILYEQSVLSFFNSELKKSLKQSNQSTETNQKIIEIIKHTWSITLSKKYEEIGIWTMLIEMVKLRVNQIDILQLFVNVDLQIDLINQFNQRNMMSTLIWAVQNLGEDEDERFEFCLWVRFAGKICVNEMIRQKIFRQKIHEMVMGRVDIIEKMKKQQNLAYFFANLSYEFPNFCEWCINANVIKKMIDYLIKDSKNYKKIQEYFQFLHFFLSSTNNPQTVIYLLYNGFCSLMRQFLVDKSYLLASHTNQKHYYKTLSLLINPVSYKLFSKGVFGNLMFFLKQKHSPYIAQCALKLVQSLQQRSDFQQLYQQGFQQTNTVFDSKVKDDESYQYILEMYMVILKKFGNICPNFFDLTFVYRILRKSVYSINIRGKFLMLQFFNILSRIDRRNYGNANCIRVFQSVLNYQCGRKELQQLLESLKIEKQLPKPIRQNKSQEEKQLQKYPMRFKIIAEIPENQILEILLQQILTCPPSQQNNIELVCECLCYFTNYDCHALRIYNKMGRDLLNGKNQREFTIELKLQIFNKILKHSSVRKLIELNSVEYKKFVYGIISEMEDICRSDQLKDEIKFIKNFCEILTTAFACGISTKEQNLDIISNLKKKNLHTQKNITQTIQILSKGTTKPMNAGIKSIMTSGVRVKMYKQDKSTSELILFFREDLTELCCVIKLGEPVKQKWKLSISSIQSINEYTKGQQFKNSIFSLSESIFTKAPEPERCLSVISITNKFFICFLTEEVKKQWSEYIKTAFNLICNQ